MIFIKRASIFELRADVRINTVNVYGVMGAGVALAFRRRYPEMFQSYKLACELGQVQIGTLHTFQADDCLIVNLPTKLGWRSPSQYNYVEAGLRALRDLLQRIEAGKRVTIPALGCGNGGLDWGLVLPIIELELAPIAELHEITLLEPL